MFVHNEVQQGTCVIFATSLFVSHTDEAKLVYGDCLCVCACVWVCGAVASVPLLLIGCWHVYSTPLDVL